MAFNPDAYAVPDAGPGKFLDKLPEGDTTIRILSDVVSGWVGWTTANKPVFREVPDFKDVPLKPDQPPRHFKAWAVWNYEAGRVQVWKCTQAKIQRPIAALVKNKAWGDPKRYDLTVTRTGTTKDNTDYIVQPSPPSDLPEDAMTAWKELRNGCDLTALFRDEDVFFDIPF